MARVRSAREPMFTIRFHFRVQRLVCSGVTDILRSLFDAVSRFGSGCRRSVSSLRRDSCWFLFSSSSSFIIFRYAFGGIPYCSLNSLENTEALEKPQSDAMRVRFWSEKRISLTAYVSLTLLT